MRKLLQRLPLEFRVLYRQFLLRVVDLEALSIQADIPRFLGQFAGVLIMISLIRALLLLVASDRSAMTAAQHSGAMWNTEQSLISSMMFVAGLIAVMSWDTTFPDRRDVMVLSPLPVAPRSILLAKIAASGAIFGIAILSLNFAPGLVLSLVLGSILHFPQTFVAFWFTLAAATIFVYGSVLTIQGLTALLLSRRLFLRVSALLQLAAFAVIFAAYFLESPISTPAAIQASANHAILAHTPSYWFFALLNQLNGSLPAGLGWLALRAWIGFGIVACTAMASLLLCYLRTMKKIVEEPDLVPGARSRRWTPRFGSNLKTAVVLLTVRSLARSRHHRIVFAFYMAIVSALAFSAMKSALSAPALHPPTTDFLVDTCIMMCLSLVGLRSVFSLPISLHANWILRVTQLCPSEKYIAAARFALLLLAALPVWLYAAALSFFFRPLRGSAGHLVVLALLASIIADLSMIGMSKIPFACSYLPGKSNVQYMFWGFLFLFSAFVTMFGPYEQRALDHPSQYALLVGILAAIALGLWVFNIYRAKSAVLYYEEQLPEVITTLGLLAEQPLRYEAARNDSPFEAAGGSESFHLS